MADALRFESITFAYRQSSVFASFRLSIPEGQIAGILGPNGTGKTTLLRLASGAISPSTGSILLFGENLARISLRERARRIAVVPQETHPLFDFTVREVVLMGRSPHLGLLGLDTAKDRRIAEEAMARTDVASLAERPFRSLSGGERQRAVIARALAQEPRLLLLDEPTAFLDLRHQLAVYDLVTRLSREAGLTVVIASHDVNLAARFCGRIVLLHEGRAAADGTPQQVVAPGPIRQVYGVDVEVRPDPTTGRPWTVPIGQSSGEQDRL